MAALLILLNSLFCILLASGARALRFRNAVAQQQALFDDCSTMTVRFVGRGYNFRRVPFIMDTYVARRNSFVTDNEEFWKYVRQACSSLEGGLLCKPHFTQSQGASTVEGCYDSMVMLEKLSKQKGWFTSQPSWLAGEVQARWNYYVNRPGKNYAL